jgi:hypothetical protein
MPHRVRADICDLRLRSRDLVGGRAFLDTSPDGTQLLPALRGLVLLTH